MLYAKDRPFRRTANGSVTLDKDSRDHLPHAGGHVNHLWSYTVPMLTTLIVACLTLVCAAFAFGYAANANSTIFEVLESVGTFGTDNCHQERAQERILAYDPRVHDTTAYAFITSDGVYVPNDQYPDEAKTKCMRSFLHELGRNRPKLEHGRSLSAEVVSSAVANPAYYRHAPCYNLQQCEKKFWGVNSPCEKCESLIPACFKALGLNWALFWGCACARAWMAALQKYADLNRSGPSDKYICRASNFATFLFFVEMCLVLDQKNDVFGKRVAEATFLLGIVRILYNYTCK